MVESFPTWCFINKKKYEKKSEKKNYIDGEFEELGKDDDKKIWNTFEVH